MPDFETLITVIGITAIDDFCVVVIIAVLLAGPVIPAVALLVIVEFGGAVEDVKFVDDGVLEVPVNKPVELPVEDPAVGDRDNMEDIEPVDDVVLETCKESVELPSTELFEPKDDPRIEVLKVEGTGSNIVDLSKTMPELSKEIMSVLIVYALPVEIVTIDNSSKITKPIALEPSKVTVVLSMVKVIFDLAARG